MIATVNSVFNDKRISDYWFTELDLLNVFRVNIDYYNYNLKKQIICTELQQVPVKMVDHLFENKVRKDCSPLLEVDLLQKFFESHSLFWADAQPS